MFSLLHNVQTGVGTHTPSNKIGAEGCFPGDKAAGRVADHSPTSSAEVQNVRTILPVPHTSSQLGS
jgi:hypothetical protein